MDKTPLAHTDTCACMTCQLKRDTPPDIEHEIFCGDSYYIATELEKTLGGKWLVYCKRYRYDRGEGIIEELLICVHVETWQQLAKEENHERGDQTR